MKPRVYMAGAVEALPDLGTEWRRDLAAELVAAGCEPVWPTACLYHIANGVETVEGAKRFWADAVDCWERRYADSHILRTACLRRVDSSDVVLVRWCADVGAGTRAEIAYAIAIGLPVVVWLMEGHREYDAFCGGLVGNAGLRGAVHSSAEVSAQTAARLGRECVAVRERSDG